MSFLRVAEARAAGQLERARLGKSSPQILREAATHFSADQTYDIFLSHSYDDAEVILGIKKIIESLGLRVYVDWVDDSSLDRNKVTPTTAEVLRVRMRASTSLVYAHSATASDSKWMPWELGYFDGFNPKRVWILPLVAEYDSEFKGQEYLGLYPAIENLSLLRGQLNLGFTVKESLLPLAKAVTQRSLGVFKAA